MKIERLAGGDVALIRMSHGRANAIDGEFLRLFNALLDEARGAAALVLTGEGGIFSAGLDLPALVALDRAPLERFIDEFSATMLRLFEVPVPVVAAINGHAVAGGCVLALQADYRLMADREARIGLNEVALGIGLPAVVVETLRFAVPSSSLRPIALEGRLMLPHEAAELALVDDVVVPEQLLERALDLARRLAAQPAEATRQIKTTLRRPTVDAIARQRAGDAQIWSETAFSATTRRLLLETVARLASKKR